jgi:hypothetical protein
MNRAFRGTLTGECGRGAGSGVGEPARVRNWTDGFFAAVTFDAAIYSDRRARVKPLEGEPKTEMKRARILVRPRVGVHSVVEADGADG